MPCTTNFKTAHPDRYKMLKENARSNRLVMTPAESKLWGMIRDNQLGIKFRRQHPIADYIVDFFAYKAKLIIELDGKYHEKEDQQEEDKIREDDLKRWGYTILRFTNEQVFLAIEDVIETIKRAINK